MSVNGVTNQNTQYLQQLTSTNARKGGCDGAKATSASSQGQGSSFAQSLRQALAQLNSSASASTSGDSQGVQASIQAFLQQLLSALHQAGTGHTKPSDGDGDDGVRSSSASTGSTASSSAAGYHASIQADLQSLMKQVSASSTTDSGLQQSFQDMLTAMGAGSGSQTLNGFLQSIAADMQGSSIVSTTA